MIPMAVTEMCMVLFLLVLVVCKPEDSESSDRSLQEVAELLSFSNGAWSCGYCTEINHMMVIHKEVTTTYMDKHRNEAPLDMQTEVGIPGMKCITFTGQNLDQVIVTRISGECHGSSALFRVKSNIDKVNIEVTVYGE